MSARPSPVRLLRMALRRTEGDYSHMRAPSALKPDVPSFGYADVYLSIETRRPSAAASTPTCLRSARRRSPPSYSTRCRYAVFWLAFCAAMAFTWARPGLSRGAHVLAFSAPLAFGPLHAGGAMYLESLALALVVGAAAPHRRGVGGLPHELAARVRLARQRARQPRAHQGHRVLGAAVLLPVLHPHGSHRLPYTPGAGAAGGAVPVDRRARDGRAAAHVRRRAARARGGVQERAARKLPAGAVGGRARVLLGRHPLHRGHAPGAAQHHQHLLDVRAAGRGGRVFTGHGGGAPSTWTL